MKSKRRAIGLSLGFAALFIFAAWLARDLWPGSASVPSPDSAAPDAAGGAENEDPGASDEQPEMAMGVNEAGDKVTPLVDFTGQWQLDAEASDSLDPILKAIGLSIFERTLVNNTVVTHIITQAPDLLTLEISTAFFERTDRLPLNGEPTPTLDPGGRPVESVNCWSDDRKQLISKIVVAKPVEQKFTVTRSLDEEHDRMEVLIEFFPKEGKPLTSRRVYRRISPEAAGK